MYSNVFDTVNTDVADCINFEALLYTSILSGLHPTLSLSQAIDSSALFAMLENDQKEGNHFLKFIEKGYVRVALYGDLHGDRNEIIKYLSDKLVACSKDPQAFKFSSLPFLYDDCYKDRSACIFKKMNEVLLNNEPFGNSAARDAGMNLSDPTEESHIYLINSHLSSVRKLEAAVQRRYVLSKGPTEDKKLYESFLEYGKCFVSEKSNSEFSDYMEDFKKYIESKKGGPDESKLNSRTYLRDLLSEKGYKKNVHSEFESIIDLCYNEKVAASISDHESDIMVSNNDLLFTQTYSDHIAQDTNFDKANQRLGLIENSEKFEQEIFTWGLLDEIIVNVEKHITKKPGELCTDEWYEYVQRYCIELGKQELKIKRRQQVVGELNFLVSAIMANSINAVIRIPVEDPFLQRFVNGIVRDIVGHVTSKVIERITPNSIEKNSEEKNIGEQQNIINELLTQTSLLKKDYNE